MPKEAVISDLTIQPQSPSTMECCCTCCRVVTHESNKTSSLVPFLYGTWIPVYVTLSVCVCVCVCVCGVCVCVCVCALALWTHMILCGSFMRNIQMFTQTFFLTELARCLLFRAEVALRRIRQLVKSDWDGLLKRYKLIVLFFSPSSYIYSVYRAMECVTRRMELRGYREKCSRHSSPQCLAIDLKK